MENLVFLCLYQGRIRGSYRPKGGMTKIDKVPNSFEKWHTFLQKTAFLHSFAEPNAMQKIIEKLLKMH